MRRVDCDNARRGKAVKEPLRDILVGSHIAAIAIAALLIWALDSGFRAVWEPLPDAGTYLVTAFAIRSLPYYSGIDSVSLARTFSYSLAALVSFAAAFFLSRWVYGVGPLRVLATYRDKLKGGNNV
jgi:hypothetical protein